MTRQPHTVLDHLTEQRSRDGVKAGDELLMPVQPPFGSRVRVNGGRYFGVEFELATSDSWVCNHRGRVLVETWPALLGSARSAGVTVLRVGRSDPTATVP